MATQWEKLHAVDPWSDADLGIDYAHHEIHEGRSFTVDAQSLSVASGNSLDLTVLTPDTTRWCHLVWDVFVSGEADVYLYEGATATGGAAFVPVNRDRNSAKVSGCTVAVGPSVSNAGTQLRLRRVGAGRTSGTDRGVAEIVLKRATKYLFRVTSRSAGNNLSVVLDWYEHQNRSAA